MKRYLFEIYTKSGATKCGFVDAKDEWNARARLVDYFGPHKEVILDNSKEDRPDWGNGPIYYLSHDRLNFEIFEESKESYHLRYDGESYGAYESLWSAIWHAERIDVE